MRIVSLLILALLPALSGCSLTPAEASVPARVLWNEEDAAQQLASLKAATESRFDTIEQRLDALEAPEVERPAPTFPAVRTISAEVVSPQSSVSRQTLALHPQPSTLNDPLPLCITIQGIDWDLDQLLAKWCKEDTEWALPEENGPQTLAILREHLTSTAHSVTGIESVPDALLPEIHEAVCEMELAQTQEAQPAPPPPAPPRAVSVSQLPQIVLHDTPANPCPNGLCPRPTSSSTRPVIVPNPAGPQRQSAHTFTSTTTRERPGLFRVLAAPVRWILPGHSRRPARRCR